MDNLNKHAKLPMASNRKSIEEILASFPNNNLKDPEIIFVVKEIVSENIYEISDSSTTAYLELNSSTNENKLAKGDIYKLTAFHLKKPDKIIPESSSSICEDLDTINLYNHTERVNFPCVGDIVHNMNRNILPESLMLKVISVFDAQYDKTGRKYRLVYVSNNYFDFYITFFEDESDTDTFLSENSVYLFKNLYVDRIFHSADTLSGSNLVFRSERNTKVEKFDEDNLPDHYVDVLEPSFINGCIEGKLRFIDQPIVYYTCPGEKSNCGKRVYPKQEWCSNISCRRLIFMDQLLEDYQVNFVILGISGIQNVKVSKRCLNSFEKEGVTVFERIRHLLNLDLQARVEFGVEKKVWIASEISVLK